MQQNYMGSYQPQQCPYPQSGANAVSINIFTPQAYASAPNQPQNVNQDGFYSLYGANPNSNLPLYPMNYNNLAGAKTPQVQPQNAYQQMQNMPLDAHQGMNQDTSNNALNRANMANNSNLISKTQNDIEDKKTEEKKDEKTKKVTPLTDDYIKSLENYMNNDNPKIRLIGAKELLERFKEDENRKDNPSLMPLLNKALKDTSPSVRFLALTILQLGYALGNDETVSILKEIQSQNQDKIGEDSLLASEILLNMSAPQKVDVPMTQNEIEKQSASKKEDKQGGN